MIKKYTFTAIFLTIIPPFALPIINNTVDSDNIYHSTFQPSPLAEKVLREGKILAPQETPKHMMERVVGTLFAVEAKFNTDPAELKNVAHEFGTYLDAGLCIMSTPILTNAGRYDNKPLSACTVPLIDWKKETQEMVKIKIDSLHQDGMGTGFNLDELEDPVAILQMLNKIAVEGAKSNKEDRPVGNIAILSINHPKIIEFIEAKKNADLRAEKWNFNISVSVDDSFMKALFNKADYKLRNGTTVSAQELMEKIAQNVHLCGDPGFLFLSRVNQGNPTPGVGEYLSVAPCGEVGLAAGESCQFGYINIGKFLISQPNSMPIIDFKKLEQVTRLMVRALDNALEVSIDKYAFEEQSEIMKMKRKIGVGICGLADLFIKSGIPYADEQARIIAQDIMAFINYHSKDESHELAKTRGSFGAMALESGCKYNENPGFIEQRFGSITTQHISTDMWRTLDKKIRDTKLLRNSSTIALPPTGRSALIVDASTAIEPLFSLIETHEGKKQVHPLLLTALTHAGVRNPTILKKIGELGCIGSVEEIPVSIRTLFKTALELSADEHLSMMESLQAVVDESISKTVNVKKNVTIPEIIAIYCQAYTKGLKGITIYRDNSRTDQPKELASQH